MPTRSRVRSGRERLNGFSPRALGQGHHKAEGLDTIRATQQRKSLRLLTRTESCIHCR
jgi:hypothetical protein